MKRSQQHANNPHDDCPAQFVRSSLQRSVLKALLQLDSLARRFVVFSQLVVLSTHSMAGAADASPRDGEAGFVKLLDDATLRVNGRAQVDIDLALRTLCPDMLTGKPRVPKLVMRVSVQATYLHCAKALMRSDLWNPARHIDLSQQPTMGAMLRDQTADRVAPGTVFETQEQMLERYRNTL